MLCSSECDSGGLAENEAAEVPWCSWGFLVWLFGEGLSLWQLGLLIQANQAASGHKISAPLISGAFLVKSSQVAFFHCSWLVYLQALPQA